MGCLLYKILLDAVKCFAVVVTGLLLAVAVGVISGVVIGFVLLVFIFACRRRSVPVLLHRINPVLFKLAVTVTKSKKMLNY